MDNKETLARLILATAEIADTDTPAVPAGLAERTAAVAADLPVVRRILGASYTVAPGRQMSAIRCTSRTGMQDDNEEAWAPVMAALRQHFGPRLLEVDDNVCYRHTDFTIYLRASTSFVYLTVGEPVPPATAPSGRNDCPSGCPKCPTESAAPTPTKKKGTGDE